VVQGSLWAGSCSSSSSSSSSSSAGDLTQDNDAALGQLSTDTAAAGDGAHAVLHPRRQPCPPADKQQAPARALPPFSPRRRTRLYGGLAPGSQHHGIYAVSSAGSIAAAAAAGPVGTGFRPALVLTPLMPRSTAARQRVGQQDLGKEAAGVACEVASPAASFPAAAHAPLVRHGLERQPFSPTRREVKALASSPSYVATAAAAVAGPGSSGGALPLVTS
jgi:hypothetical protein